MTATELHLKDGRSAGIFFCSKCRHVHSSEHWAEQCCQNYKCTQCGKDTGSRAMMVCQTCRNAGDEAKERERFDKAEKLTAWDGWVYDGSEFYEGVEEMLDLRDGDDTSEYVWTCKSTQFVSVDVDSLLEHIEENGYEDFDADTLKGLDELKAAIKAFEDANADVVSYEPDYTKAVLIEKGTP